MNVKNMKIAMNGASRFLDTVLEYKHSHREDWDKEKDMIWGSKESSAVRRASMDLTRALAQMRKP